MLYTSFLHQTTTTTETRCKFTNCFIPLFYIKPQLLLKHRPYILHCFIPLFYIKPQLLFTLFLGVPYCFIPLFYIKPQRVSRWGGGWGIALYLFSTSNHNQSLAYAYATQIALYLFSTSNHNLPELVEIIGLLLYTSFLHQTTTLSLFRSCCHHCFIPLFYIKPQRSGRMAGREADCFIPLFYIKPQHIRVEYFCFLNCFIPLFYIKPQLCVSVCQRTKIALYLFSTSNHNSARGLHVIF